MTSVASPQAAPTPHVKVERRVTSPTRESRATNVVSPTSPTQRPLLATNKRYANVQSKVGSLDAISYKPKQSEKKVQSFKHDFSHVKSKVDAKLVLPAVEHAGSIASDAPGSPPASTTAAAATSVKDATPKRPTVVTAGVSSAASRGNSASHQKALSPSSRTPSASAASPVKNTSPQSTTSAHVPVPHSLPQSRRSSNSSSVASPPTSPSSPPRRMSKHIIPTQKAQYNHVKSKVGSFDNITFGSRGRASSQSSSADEGTNGGALSPSNGRSRSPSALSSTSSTGNTAPTSPSRRPSFKIPASRKADYSKVGSKVGSLEYISHTPQGGNLKVFSEKLNFREQAQSKIAKEINIVQFYQSDQSFDTSMQEKGEQEYEGEQQRSIIYGSEADEEDFEPPKNILSVLEEVAESVGELGLEEQHGNDHEQEQEHEQQANEAHTNVELAATM